MGSGAGSGVGSGAAALFRRSHDPRSFVGDGGCGCGSAASGSARARLGRLAGVRGAGGCERVDSSRLSDSAALPSARRSSVMRARAVARATSSSAIASLLKPRVSTSSIAVTASPSRMSSSSSGLASLICATRGPSPNLRPSDPAGARISIQSTSSSSSMC